MAAKPAKKENRGGKRPGAGRPPGREPLSVRQIKEMQRKMKERAKLTGRDENDILIDFIQGEDADGNPVKCATRDRIACIKLWKDYTSPKISEGGQADKQLGPTIYLPEHDAPDNVTPIK